MTVQQNDSIMLSVFIANGRSSRGPSSPTQTARASSRKRHGTEGREYTAFFPDAKRVGTYRLDCAVHRPSMSAEIVVLPTIGRLLLEDRSASLLEDTETTPGGR